MSVPSQLLRAAVLSCLVLIVLNAGAQPTNGAEVRQTIPAPGTNETLCLMLPKSAGRPVDRETPSKPGEIWCRGLYDPIPGAKTAKDQKYGLQILIQYLGTVSVAKGYTERVTGNIVEYGDGGREHPGDPSAANAAGGGAAAPVTLLGVGDTPDYIGAFWCNAYFVRVEATPANIATGRKAVQELDEEMRAKSLCVTNTRSNPGATTGTGFKVEGGCVTQDQGIRCTVIASNAPPAATLRYDWFIDGVQQRNVTSASMRVPRLVGAHTIKVRAVDTKTNLLTEFFEITVR